MRLQRLPQRWAPLRAASGSCLPCPDPPSPMPPQGEQTPKKQPLYSVLQALDPETRYGLGVVAAGTSMMAMSFGCVTPILPLFASQWGDVGATGVGAVIAAPALAKLLLSQAAGRRADTHGRVGLMRGGAAVSAIGSGATAVVDSLPAVCGSRMVVGLGSAGCTPASQAYLADLTSGLVANRGAVMGTLGAISMAAYGLGPAVGGLIAESFGPSACFGVVAAASAGSALLYSTLPETLSRKGDFARAHHGERLDAKGTNGAASPAQALAAPQPEPLAAATRPLSTGHGYLALVRRNVVLQEVMVMDAACYVGWTVWLAVVPLHAVEVWGATPGTLGLM